MNDRNVAAEVLDGLQEVREHRAGKLSLRTTRLLEPLPGFAPLQAADAPGQTRPRGGNPSEQDRNQVPGVASSVCSQR